MSKSYTPGLKILKSTILSKKRLLPLKGEVHVDKNEAISHDTIVASTKIPGNVHMVNLSKQLNVEPNGVKDLMLIEVDEKIVKGQVIAESKGLFGMFKASVKSPVDGFLLNVSDITGQATISEPALPVEIDSYIDGMVQEVFDKEGVLIQSNCAIIQGILGVGGENKGEIKVLTKTEQDEIISDMITPDLNGKIVVGGSYITLDAYRKAQKMNVSGIIVGGFNYTDLSQLLGFNLGVAITGSENLGTSLLITEGFGKIKMARRTFKLFNSLEGRYGSINGATQIRAGVIRPEVVVALDSDNEKHEEFNEDELVINVGSNVRVIRAPYFGKVGTVAELPSELLKMESETLVRVAKIKFENGEFSTVPRANLEVILQD